MNCKKMLIYSLILILGLWSGCNEDISEPSNEVIIDPCEQLSNLSKPSQLEPNTLDTLSVSEIQTEALSCTLITLEGTSPEHSLIRAINPAAYWSPGTITPLNAHFSTQILSNLGGWVKLIIRKNTFSANIEVPNTHADRLEGVFTVQSKLPNDLGTDGVNIKVHEAYSAKQLAASIGLHASGLVYDFVSQMDYSSNEYKHRYVATVFINDFNVEVEYPGRCKVYEAWFPEATQNELNDLELMPVYVKRVTYGKMLQLTIETNLSKEQVYANLEASFDGLLSDGGANLEAGYADLKSESNISIQAIGGSLDAVVEVLTTTNNSPLQAWLNRVKEDRTGRTSAPILTELAFLHDGSNANVVLATDDYTIRRCESLPIEYEEVLNLNNFKINDPCNTGDHNPFEYICPIHVGDGDRDFGGQCTETATVELEKRNNDTELWVNIYFEVREPNPDYTEGEIFFEVKVFDSPQGYIIKSIDSDIESSIYHLDEDHTLDIFPMGESELVRKFIIRGDGQGKDVRSNSEGECNCEDDPKSYLTILFNYVHLTVAES